VTVEADVSWDIDMGITNWDQNKGNYLFLNTSNPVYVNSEENIPDGFVLYQNYPNPFNPSTKIKFNIPQSPLLGGDGRGGLVTLKIYDVLGNEIATLVNEELSVGDYEVEFLPESSIKNPASGIYFYQLRAGEYTNTKKMILLR